MATQSSYEAVIGIEVHVQLATQSKIFCPCAVQPRAKPNTHICHICAGHPGTLPVLNEKVVEYAIMVGLATNCTVQAISEFSRKHYFYPDLPKGFQITQADRPIALNGHLTITVGGTAKKIRIRRIHIEEDAGKSIHAADGSMSFVDLNRAGTPLLEIVTEPDLSGPDEVRAYLKELHSIVTALGVCSGNMEEGAFRADTNISVRKRGATQLGTRCELKNINSFKFIGDATTFEIERQIEALESGERIVQQTRLWDTKERITVPMRSKEEAADYRYMPEPDLPLLTLQQADINRVAARMPELPHVKAARFITKYGLAPADAEILAYDTDLGSYFELVAQQTTNAKMAAGWIIRNLLGILKERDVQIATCPVTPPRFAELITVLDEGVINGPTAHELLMVMMDQQTSPRMLIAERGLQQIGDKDALRSILQAILDANPAKVAEYRAGREKLWGFFIGEAMKATKGKAQPQLLNELLRELLSNS